MHGSASPREQPRLAVTKPGEEGVNIGQRAHNPRPGTWVSGALSLLVIACGTVAANAQSAPPAPPGWSTSVHTRPPASTAVRSQRVVLEGDRTQTRLVIELSGPTTFQAFRLTDPERVVVDLANVEFRLPASTGRQPVGLVKSFRYGAFAAGKARIVMDTEGPVKVEATRILDPAGRGHHRLEIDLVRADQTDLAASEVAAAAASIPPVVPLPDAPAGTEPQPHGKPVVTIDPGHGGIDSGAQGTLGAEKDIVLAVALELQRTLAATGRYVVKMTRDSDMFVPLEQRVRFSEAAGSNLFISIHADSLASATLAKSIRGASLYTLSNRASNDAARRYAEKENAADLIAGLLPSREREQEEVRDILFDLMRRETSNLSIDLRRTLARYLRSGITLTRDPQRSANFVVLRQPATPAVLIELGYISHTEDERLMRSGEWQRKIAKAISTAVADYFRRNAATVPAALPTGRAAGRSNR